MGKPGKERPNGAGPKGSEGKKCTSLEIEEGFDERSWIVPTNLAPSALRKKKGFQIEVNYSHRVGGGELTRPSRTIVETNNLPPPGARKKIEGGRFLLQNRPARAGAWSPTLSEENNNNL